MADTRGTQNGYRQAFIYRGIQVIPTLDGGWMAVIGGRHYTENTEDEICFEIDAMHIMIEAVQHRDATPCAGVAPSKGSHKVISKSAISGGVVRSPSRLPRRYSTSRKGGAA
jgi:hypothetical protein